MQDNEAKMTSCLAKLRTTFSRLRLKNKYDLGPVKFAELSRNRPKNETTSPSASPTHCGSPILFNQSLPPMEN